MSTAAEIAHAFNAKPAANGWMACCPLHDDQTESLSIGEGSTGKVVLHCFAGCSQEALVAEVRRRGYEPDGILGSKPRAQQTQRKPKTSNRLIRIGRKEPPEDIQHRKPARRIEAVYDYRDEKGQLIYQVVREVVNKTKTFKQRRPDGRGGWIWNIDGVTQVPYHLPELQAGTETIYVTEGEKDADRLVSYGLLATTNSGGAEKIGGKGVWPQLARWFADRRIIIVPDNDEAGRNHRERVGLALKGIARSIKVLMLPGLPNKGDVSDWLDAGNTIDQFRRLAHEAPHWEADANPADVKPEESTTDSDDDEISRLAALPRIEFDRGVKAAAKRLGIGVGLLRELVGKKWAEMRPDEDDTGGQGKRIEFPEIQPWHEQVDGVELLNQLVTAIHKYLILEPHQAIALALWVIFSHAFPAFEFAPKLIVNSPTKRAGKTLLLEMLERLVHRRVLISGTNANTLLRLIELYGPTLLLDEFDTLMKAGGEMAEALRGILNSGFKKAAAQYLKLVPSKDGGWEPRVFSTWCPQVLAGIGKVPDTVADRSIQIGMKRKLKTEKVPQLRARDGGDLDILARKVARWAGDHLSELEEADYPNNMPAELNDRASDAWSPLMAIADLAGGDWAAKARESAIALAGEQDSETIPTMLLVDIKKIFDDEEKFPSPRRDDKISSKRLVDELNEMHDRPWPEYKKGKALSQNNLAYLLREYAIRSDNINSSGSILKGYRRHQFMDVWARYLDVNVANPKAKAPAQEDQDKGDSAPRMAKVFSFKDKVLANAKQRRGEGK
jgi:putative DNA primase/helicase